MNILRSRNFYITMLAIILTLWLGTGYFEAVEAPYLRF